MDKKEVFVRIIQVSAESAAVNEIKRRLGDEKAEEAIAIIKELAEIDQRTRKHLDNMEIVPVEDIERNNELVKNLAVYEKEADENSNNPEVSVGGAKGINIGNAKGLQKTLINCSDLEKGCEGCPLENKKKEGQECLSELMKDAADVIGELVNKVETEN